MSKQRPLAVALAMFGALLVAGGVGLAQATPVASPVPIAVGECTVEPRSTAEMRELIRAQLPRVLADIEGTPIGDRESAADYDPSQGVPADAATVAAVTKTITQFVACSHAGHLPSVAALFTDQGAGAYLSLSLLAAASILPGGTPTADIDPLLLNSFLGVIQMSMPPPEEFQLRLYSINRVVEVEDGRVLAFVTAGTGSAAPGPDGFLLRPEDGEYRIIFGDEAERDTGATPVASPIP